MLRRSAWAWRHRRRLKRGHRCRRTGAVAARPRGGDRRSHHLEAHAAEILALIEEANDITLDEIVAHLDRVHGLKAAQSRVWRLLDRHGVTVKKNRARQRAATP